MLINLWPTAALQMKDGWKAKEDLVDRVVALYRQKAIKPPLCVVAVLLLCLMEEGCCNSAPACVGRVFSLLH